MTGRWYDGDENGNTVYQYSTLKAIDESNNPVNAKIEVTDIQWSEAIKESDGTLFQAAPNRVIVGRKHTGDENGPTVCLYASLKLINAYNFKVDGDITITDIHWSDPILEAQLGFKAPDGYVILGRQHTGGAASYTRYKLGKILVNNIATTVEPAEAIVPYQIYDEDYGVFFQTSPYLLYTGRMHLNPFGTQQVYNLMGLVRVNK